MLAYIHNFEFLPFSKCFPCPVGVGGRSVYVIYACVHLYVCAHVRHMGRPKDIESPVSLTLELGWLSASKPQYLPHPTPNV